MHFQFLDYSGILGLQLSPSLLCTVTMFTGVLLYFQHFLELITVIPSDKEESNINITSTALDNVTLAHLFINGMLLCIFSYFVPTVLLPLLVKLSVDCRRFFFPTSCRVWQRLLQTFSLSIILTDRVVKILS